jgi:hypothetical protein
MKLKLDLFFRSKFEKALGQFKLEQTPLINKILKTLWLADQTYDVVKDEKFANEAM